MVLPSSQQRELTTASTKRSLPCWYLQLPSLIVTGGQPTNLTKINHTLQRTDENQDIVGPQLLVRLRGGNDPIFALDLGDVESWQVTKPGVLDCFPDQRPVGFDLDFDGVATRVVTDADRRSTIGDQPARGDDHVDQPEDRGRHTHRGGSKEAERFCL